MYVRDVGLYPGEDGLYQDEDGLYQNKVRLYQVKLQVYPGDALGENGSVQEEMQQCIPEDMESKCYMLHG